MLKLINIWFNMSKGTVLSIKHQQTLPRVRKNTEYAPIVQEVKL